MGCREMVELQHFLLKQFIDEPIMHMRTLSWVQQALMTQCLQPFLPTDLLKTDCTTSCPSCRKKKLCQILNDLGYKILHGSRSLGTTQTDQRQFESKDKQGPKIILKQYLSEVASNRKRNACDPFYSGWATPSLSIGLLPKRRKIWNGKVTTMQGGVAIAKHAQIG